MSTLAEFDGYKLRTVDTLADIQTLDDWIQADEAHRAIYNPSFFMSGKFNPDSRAACYAIEDADGVIFYIRLSRASRAHIQFPPEDTRKRGRIARALKYGMVFLEHQLARAGCEEWVFNTETKRLKKYAELGLGFTASTHELVRLIPDPAGEKQEVA